MTTNEKLSMLREKMAEAGVQAYLIPSSDPHISEYLPDHWRARAWLSGFDGLCRNLSGHGNGERSVDRRPLFYPGGAADGRQ